jgi:hypothetical protein
MAVRWALVGGLHKSGKEMATMAEEETPGGEEERGGGHPLRKLIALVAGLGAGLAALMRWRRRGGEEEGEGEPPPE